jgi:hypothetical protein
MATAALLRMRLNRRSGPASAYIDALLDAGDEIDTIVDHMVHHESSTADASIPEVLRSLLVDVLECETELFREELEIAADVLTVTAGAIESGLFLVEPEAPRPPSPGLDLPSPNGRRRRGRRRGDL